MLGLSGTSSYAVFVYLCILYLYFCICMFDTREYHFWYPWTILFSKICHMMGLYGTVNMLYLCICVFVFVYLCMRHLVISVLISLDQELSENIWFVWSKTSYCGENVGCHACGRTTDGQRNVKIELEFWKQNSQYEIWTLCAVRSFGKISPIHPTPLFEMLTCTSSIAE